MKTLLVFLHDSGGNGIELSSFLNTTPLDAFDMHTFRYVADLAEIDIVTPTANQKAYCPASNMMSMNMWFGIIADIEDLTSVEFSTEKIMQIVHENSEYDNIFIGGFSMGGSLALHLLRKYLPANVKGIFSIGSFLVESSVVLRGIAINASKIPVLMMHGKCDSLVRHEWGKFTATGLSLMDINVQFKDFEHLGHEIGEEQLEDLIHWMQDIMTTSNTTNIVPPISVTSQLRRNEEDETKSDPSTFYRIETLSAATFRIHFKVPSQLAALAASRPVLACGGCFDLVVPTTQTQNEFCYIYTMATSTQPDKLAQEIAMRLKIRLESSRDGAMHNPCPMS